MSDPTHDASEGITGAVAPSDAEKAVCGPVCVSAGTCACGDGQGDTAPSQAAAAGRSSGEAPAGAVWVPPECTLPVVRQPERVAEFDALFTTAVRAVARPERTVLHLVLDAACEADARDLAARESGCCSFFTFAFTGHYDGLLLEITVPTAQVAVLDALAERAAAALQGVAR
jgi:hypothetical protein